MAEEFIGCGWSFPLQTTPAGTIALSRGDAKLNQAIRLILGTAKGERPMRPEFGCGIHDLVFAPMNADTAGRIAYEVRASLARWEPRIDVIDVQVSADQEQLGLLYIDIHYHAKGSYDLRNLVFPFYTIPEEP